MSAGAANRMDILKGTIADGQKAAESVLAAARLDADALLAQIRQFLAEYKITVNIEVVKK